MPAPAFQAADEPQEIDSLLGKGSTFDGKLIFEGTVRIDGKLTGEIFSEDVLVVGEGAEVKAQIDVGVLIVEGHVEGTIRAARAVELHAPARVRGSIETPSLFIDKGVVFEGTCKMENLAGRPGASPPTAGAAPIPKPAAPAKPGPTTGGKTS